MLRTCASEDLQSTYWQTILEVVLVDLTTPEGIKKLCDDLQESIREVTDLLAEREYGRIPVRHADRLLAAKRHISLLVNFLRTGV